MEEPGVAKGGMRCRTLRNAELKARYICLIFLYKNQTILNHKASGSRSRTRLGAKEYDAEREFPPAAHQAPHTEERDRNVEIRPGTGGQGVVTTAMAVREVAKQIYAKYYHGTIYCVSLHTIHRRVEDLKRVYSEGRMRYSQNRENFRAVKDYKELFEKKDKQFEVYTEDPVRRQAVEKEWGVSMSEMEHMYYEDQKTDRKMFCSRGVDPVWYHSAMRTQRMKDRMEEYRSEKEHQFQYKTLNSISELLAEAGEIPSNDSSSNEELSPVKRLAKPTEGIGRAGFCT